MDPELTFLSFRGEASGLLAEKCVAVLCHGERVPRENHLPYVSCDLQHSGK